MFFVFIWEQAATCAPYSINWLVFITEIKSVYCAVPTGYLNKGACASSLKGQICSQYTEALYIYIYIYIYILPTLYQYLIVHKYQIFHKNHISTFPIMLCTFTCLQRQRILLLRCSTALTSFPVDSQCNVFPYNVRTCADSYNKSQAINPERLY